MRMHQYNAIIQLFQTTIENKVLSSCISHFQKPFSFSISSVESILRSIQKTRKYSMVDQVWSQLDDKTRDCCCSWSVYCRILLSDKRISEARPFLDEIQHQAYSNPLCNNEILQGLYSGKYYEECLHFYKGLQTLDPAGGNLGDVTSYYSALKAAYQLHDYRQVVDLHAVLKKRNLPMSRSIVYILAEVIASWIVHL